MVNSFRRNAQTSTMWLLAGGLALTACQGAQQPASKAVGEGAPVAAAPAETAPGATGGSGQPSAPPADGAKADTPKEAPLKLGFDTQMPGPFKRDTVTFKLGPYEGREYVYRLDKGAGMVYSWKATAKVKYDFHGQPDGSPADYAETFVKGEAAESHGVFLSPAPGIHGWFWENPGIDDVTVTLTSSGFYTAATEYGADGKTEHKLRDR